MAASALEALLSAELEKPYLALVNIHLRKPLDRIHLAEQLRDKYRIPVIYLTGEMNQNTLHLAKSAEPLGFIVKPFTAKDVEVAMSFADRKLQQEKLKRSNER